MSFKDVTSGNVIDIKTDKDNPYIGVYTGNKKIETKIGQQIIYTFRNNEAKEIFSIYGFTNLNRAMENVLVGTYCRITYLGTENVKTKFGMKDVHQCKVEIDDEYIYHETNENDDDMPVEEIDILEDDIPF